MSLFWRPLPLLFQFLTGIGGITVVDVIISFFSIAVLIFVLFPFHEYAHAWAAYKLGDHTAKNEGRLTLNPIAHIDPIGALIMLFLPIGWAKPVPVDARNATRKVSMRGFIALTAAAGPLSNIILSLIFVIISKVLLLLMGANMFSPALWMIAHISVFLAVFNLIPIPPLDGSKILYFFLSTRAIYAFEKHAHVIRMVLLISLFIPGNPLLWLISTGARTIMLGLHYATFFLG
jgi:Zn-dependent protease